MVTLRYVIYIKYFQLSEYKIYIINIIFKQPRGSCASDEDYYPKFSTFALFPKCKGSH